jgi:hypothetical protein
MLSDDAGSCDAIWRAGVSFQLLRWASGVVCMQMREGPGRDFCHGELWYSWRRELWQRLDVVVVVRSLRVQGRWRCPCPSLCWDSTRRPRINPAQPRLHLALCPIGPGWQDRISSGCTPPTTNYRPTHRTTWILDHEHTPCDLACHLKLLVEISTVTKI